jgi:hypothetical protein
MGPSWSFTHCRLEATYPAVDQLVVVLGRWFQKPETLPPFARRHIRTICGQVGRSLVMVQHFDANLTLTIASVSGQFLLNCYVSGWCCLVSC